MLNNFTNMFMVLLIQLNVFHIKLIIILKIEMPVNVNLLPTTRKTETVGSHLSHLSFLGLRIVRMC